MPTALRHVNRRIYGYTEVLYLSFYLRRVYVDVGKRWTGIGFMYFLLLIAVLSLPLSVRAMVVFDRFFDEELLFPIKNTPVLRIQNGELIFKEPMPYLVKSKSGKVMTVIDTKGEVSAENNPYPDLVLLVTRHKFYIRYPSIAFVGHVFDDPGSHFFTEESFDKIESDSFNASSWFESSHMIRLKWVFLVLMYPLIVGFILGLCFALLMVFAMLLQAFAWLILKVKLTYAQAARMLSVASTPAMTLLTLFIVTGCLFQGAGAVCLVLLVVYFSYGALSMKYDGHQIVRIG